MSAGSAIRFNQGLPDLPGHISSEAGYDAVSQVTRSRHNFSRPGNIQAGQRGSLTCRSTADRSRLGCCRGHPTAQPVVRATCGQTAAQIGPKPVAMVCVSVYFTLQSDGDGSGMSQDEPARADVSLVIHLDRAAGVSPASACFAVRPTDARQKFLPGYFAVQSPSARRDRRPAASSHPAITNARVRQRRMW